MFSSPVAARVLCACLGFMGVLFVAGSARAQFESCPAPSEYPEVVLETIGSNADISFGDLDQNVCDGIVKKGVGQCRSQVKAAAKCGHKVADSIYDMQAKQCAQIEDAVSRASCKEGAKTFKTFNKNGYTEDMQEALVTCDEMVAFLLNAACMDLVIKVGGP